MDFSLLFEILEYRQVRVPRQAVLAGREQSGWRLWQAAELLSLRNRLSAGLLHLPAGERVGILAHGGSPHWAVLDAALQQIGLIPVPVHATARPDEVAFIVKDAGLRACFVSNQAMLERWQKAEVRVDFLYSFETLNGLIDLNQLAAAEPTAEQTARIAERRAAIRPDDLATLLYTSGTTGVPKGVMLTHKNIVSNVKSVLAIVPVSAKMRVISVLPLSHIFERMVTYMYQAAGATVYYVDQIEALPDALREIRPQFFTAVPRLLERMHERMLERRARLPRWQRRVFDWALALGAEYSYAGQYKAPLQFLFLRLIADVLVFRHWRRALGGRLRGIAVGAAALPPWLGRLFAAARIDVREGYGLTETSPVVAFNRFEPGGVRFGTVGIATPGVQIRIAQAEGDADGEVEVKGDNVMKGYWNLPEETARRFTPDGWFRTGDLGTIVHKRFLKITGRRNELFKTASGKFVAPAYVEQQLKTSPFIAQSIVVGLNRPYVGALLLPDFVQLEAWCREHQVHWTAPQFMIHNPKVQKHFQQEIDRINAELLAPAERIRGFKLLFESWTPENGLLTPTLKLKRAAFADRYAKEVEELFLKKINGTGEAEEA